MATTSHFGDPKLQNYKNYSPLFGHIKNIFVFTGGVEVVSCTAGHSHDYPFGGSKYVEGTKILWQFMKSHAKN